LVRRLDKDMKFKNSCEKITDKGLKKLGEGLQSLNYLEWIYLDFEE